MMTGDSLHISENYRIRKMLSTGIISSAPDAVYHLQDLRRGLLCWYPFRKDMQVLELGTGFGALTGILLEETAHVDTVEYDSERVQAVRQRYRDAQNLQVYEADIRTYIPEKKYDLIVIIDLLEEYEGDREELIRRYAGYLKEDGAVLLGWRNRDGIKYRCGGLDEYVTEIFGTSRLLRAEDMDRITEKYFPVRNNYYLMPDVRFPQGVYTDKYMPVYTMRDRIIPVDYFDSPLIMNEGDLYDELIRDGTLSRYSNYLIQECRYTRAGKQVIHASLCTDRSKERAVSTILYDDGTAEKKALYEEGVTTLQRSCMNLEELKQRGLLTVAQRQNGRQVTMPVVKETQLTDFLQKLCEESKQTEILNVFDQLYENMRRSSDMEKETDAYGSPVLSRAYTDMIPYNAFISEAGIRYYDQEFTEAHCPLNYVMYRAVFYTYIHIPAMARCIPQDDMYARYGISEEARQAYLQKEMRFLEEVRSWHSTDEIRPDPEKIRQNRRHLQGTDRERDYTDVHEVQLDLLRRFDRICTENGLRYYAFHGTMLGAVRHHGFIPWDDDVDLVMPREDYEKLLQLKISDERYFLQTSYNDRNSFNGGYACYRRTDTAAMRRENMYHACCEGIGIDIFPLDKCDPQTFRSQQGEVTNLQRLLYARVYTHNEPVLADISSKKRKQLTLQAKAIPYRVLLKLLKMKLTEYTGDSGYRTVFACYYGAGENRILIREEDLRHGERIPFADMDIPVIGNSDRYLKERYGENYMDIPREHMTKHSDIYYNTEKSYRECVWQKQV